MKQRITKQEATEFFSWFYGGQHHFPAQIKEWGEGYCIRDTRDMATFDFNNLTKLVVGAHDMCYRACIIPNGMNGYRICIWKRQGREGSIYDRHPTIEQAIDLFRSSPYYIAKETQTNLTLK